MVKKFCIVFAGLILMLGFDSCKKKNKGRIVPPNPYFPAWPGSYWEYSDGSKITVDGEYKDCHVGNEILSLPYIECSDGDVLGGQGYIYGYDINYGDKFYGFLRETKTITDFSRPDQGHQSLRKVLNADSTITINNQTFLHTIAVEEFDAYVPGGNNFTVDFFARDLGLIRRDQQYWHYDSLGFHTDSIKPIFWLTNSHIIKK